MRTDREAAAEAMRRAHSLRTKRVQRRGLGLVSLASVASLGLIIWLAVSLPGMVVEAPTQRAVSGTLGALFVHNASLGYIITGILGFVLGVCIALLAYMYKDKAKQDND